MIQISPDYSAEEVTNFNEVPPDTISALLSNLNDSDHMRFSRHRLAQHTFESSKDFLRELRAVGGHYYLISQVETGLTAGTFTVKPLGESQCESGILVFRDFLNQGIACSIWRFLPSLVAGLGFEFLVSGTNIQNFPMRRVMEKAGMELDPSRNFPYNKDSSSENIYFISHI